MKPYLALMCFMIIASLGCARYDRVIATEESARLEYESLGTLEVSRNIKLRGVSKFLLRRKLAELADERYGADAVINVEYWPDPESTKKFPEGRLYARGEMIRYKRFPKPASLEPRPVV